MNIIILSTEGELIHETRDTIDSLGPRGLIYVIF